MSMMGTLGKVAMGIIVAKGMSKVMGGGSSSAGGLLGGLLGGQGNQRQSSGGLSDMLGAGGLGSLLGGASGGGLGGLLGSLAGGGTQNNSVGNSGQTKDFSSMFNDAIQGKEPEPTPEQDQQAQIMLRAMISAAKADGHVDEEEKKKIVEHLKDISDEDAEMVRNELQAPLDIQGLIDSVPKGMEQQVYLMSLLAIDLDSKEEAVYLNLLGKGLNISHQESNQIHEKLGVPTLYN
ncbi:MAG: tellurite resistance TerB family protein [Cocleimonas sp.]|nr:tellurite resistance TerB family protein [Cocleimonas sp.]